jgi:DNA-binding transcriptional regulator GbsR (MarR family)
MNEEILALRKLGLSIGEIAERTGYSITKVCEVIQAQNDKDIANDK